MTTRLLAFLALFLFLPAGASAAEDGWVLAAKARKPEDISLWTRYIPGAELKAFRGVTHTSAPMDSVIALLHDATRMQEWVFRCREARILGQAENGDTYVYLKISGIWPVGDRDAVIRVHPTYNPRTGEIDMQGIAAPDYLPRNPDYVRIPMIESSWKLTPAPMGLTRIEWTGHVDPAGSVPRWLSNLVATLVPRHTLSSVRDLLDGETYRTPAQRELGHDWIEKIRAASR